ncbi:MAG: hypothetical protein ABI307_01865, partial [Mycobacterium sp.]
AALASAHAPLFDSSTSALAWARDPGTGMIDPALVALGYAYMPGGSTDYDATMGEQALAYSAVDDDDDADRDYLFTPDGEASQVAAEFEDSAGLGLLDGEAVIETRSRKPFLLAGSGLAAFFVIAVSALVVALAVSIRPTAASHPAPSQHIVVPTRQAPAPAPQLPAPPAPAAPPVQAPVPVVQQGPVAQPPVLKAPAPVPAAPVPAAPAPAPVAPAPILIPIPIQVPAPAPIWRPAPAPVAPAPAPVAPAPESPQLPSIFNPPKSPPKNDGGFPDGGGRRDGPSWLPGEGGGGQRGQAPSPWLPSNEGRGGGSPWFPGLGGGGRGGGSQWFPGFGGGGHDGGHGGGGSQWFPGLGGGGGHGGFRF